MQNAAHRPGRRQKLDCCDVLARRDCGIESFRWFMGLHCAKIMPMTAKWMRSIRDASLTMLLASRNDTTIARGVRRNHRGTGQSGRYVYSGIWAKWQWRPAVTGTCVQHGASRPEQAV